MPTNHPFTPQPHEVDRIRQLKPGEPMVFIRPVEPQPKLTPSGLWNWKGHVFGTVRHESGGETAYELPAEACPYRPGDVLVWKIPLTQTEGYAAVIRDEPTECRVAVQSVEAKMVRRLQSDELLKAGGQYIQPPEWSRRMSAELRHRDHYEAWWNTTYADRPELDWDRAWAWLYWTGGSTDG